MIYNFIRTQASDADGRIATATPFGRQLVCYLYRFRSIIIIWTNTSVRYDDFQFTNLHDYESLQSYNESFVSLL